MQKIHFFGCGLGCAGAYVVYEESKVGNVVEVKVAFCRSSMGGEVEGKGCCWHC